MPDTGSVVVPNHIWQEAILNTQIMWILALVTVFLACAFFLYWILIRIYAPEAPLYAAARRRKLPIIYFHDTSGAFVRFLGIPSKEADDPRITNKKVTTLTFDPAHVGIPIPDRTLDGVREYHFIWDNPFPFGIKNAQAVKTIINDIRSKHPELARIPDTQLFQLWGSSRDDLQHDADMYLTEYEIEDMSKESLVDIITKAQDNATKTPLANREVAYNFAIPFADQGLKSSLLDHVEMLYQKIAWEERRRHDNMMGWMGPVVLFSCVGLGILFIIINSGAL